MAAMMMTDRGLSWTDVETSDLIAIWGEENIQRQLEGARHVNKIFCKIAEGMVRKGHDRDAESCQAKIKRIKERYRKELKDYNTSGGAGRLVNPWRYFESVHLIMGKRPASLPGVLIQTTSIDGLETGDETSLMDSTDVASFEENPDHHHLAAMDPPTVLETSEILGDAEENDLIEQSRTQSACKLSDRAPKATKRKSTFGSFPLVEQNSEKKKNRMEKQVDAIIAGFTNSQKESDMKFLAFEEKRLQAEINMDQRHIEAQVKRDQFEAEMRAQERQHEARMMEMMMMMFRANMPAQHVAQPGRPAPFSHQNHHDHVTLIPLTSEHPKPSTSSIPPFSQYGPYEP